MAKLLLIGLLGAIAPAAVCFTVVEYYFASNVSALFAVGSEFARQAPTPADAWVSAGAGYDGQFGYRIASRACRGPISLPAASESLGIDAPWYRYRRILLPMLASVGVGGNESRLGWAFVAVNAIACGLGALFLAADLRSRGDHPWLGLVWIAAPGILLGCVRQLNEPLALALVAGGLFAFKQNRIGLASFAFSLAALAHEATLVLPIGLLFSASTNDKRKMYSVLGVPVLIAGVWALALGWHFDRLGDPKFLSAGGAQLSWPVLGWLEKILTLETTAWLAITGGYTGLSKVVVEIALLAPTFTALGIIGRLAWRSNDAFRWPSRLSLLLVSCYTFRVLADPTDYCRLTLVPLALALFAGPANQRLSRWLIASLLLSLLGSIWEIDRIASFWRHFRIAP